MGREALLDTKDETDLTQREAVGDEFGWGLLRLRRTIKGHDFEPHLAWINPLHQSPPPLGEKIHP